MKTLSEIYSNIRQGAENTFIAFENHQLSYEELGTRIQQISFYYSDNHLTAGDRIIINSTNDEAVILFSITALLNGYTSVIIPPDTKASRIASLIAHVEPGLIVSDRENASVLDELFLDKDQYAPTFIIEKKQSDKKSSLFNKFKNKLKKKSWKDSLDDFEACEPALSADYQQFAFIYFSSGTTSEPKGIPLSYHNLFSHLETIGRQFDYNKNSRILNNMMLSHVDGMLQGPMLTLYFSAFLCRPCNMDIQQIEYYLNSLTREQITHAITVPTLLNFFDRLASYDDYFSNEYFKHLISVAGMLPEDLWERLEKRFNIRISNMYGLTETVTGGLFCGPDDNSYKRGSVGKPIDIKCLILDSDGQPLKTGQEGELCLKGNNVFSGYLDQDSDSSKVFWQGWFRSGDIAYADENGFIHISGRAKELIVSGGFNIHPAEVNEALMKNKSLIDVATIGLLDPDLQEIAVSLVVLDKDCEFNESEIINDSRQYLEARKVPKEIVCVDKIPRGDSGKIQIPKLQQLLDKKDSTHLEKITLDDFFSIVSKELHVEVKMLSLASRAGEIPGWDSLGHLRLVLAVEKAANVCLSANNIMSIASLNELWEIIQEK